MNAAIGTFNSEYNEITDSNCSCEYSGNLADGYVLSINEIYINSNQDSRDRLRYQIFDENGNVIMSDYLRNGDNQVNIGTYFNKFTLKIYEAKCYHSDLPPVLFDTIYEKTFDMSELNIDPIDEENMTFNLVDNATGDIVGYQVSIPINNGYEGNGYEMRIVEEYKDGTSDSVSSEYELSSLSKNIDHSSDGKMEQIDRIIIYIYYSDGSYGNTGTVSVITKTIE